MSTMNPPNASINPHIASLQEMFSASAEPIEWLIICHDDMHLVRELLAASGGRPAALLRVRQDAWDDRLLCDAVSWAVHQNTIVDIVLAGHSQTGPVVESPHQTGSTGGYNRLVDGARHYSQEIEGAHRRFASHVDRLMGTAEVQGRVATGALSVHPILYRADSGLFFAYRFDQGCFQPLVH